MLPFDDAGFDAVIGVNAFQFAGDPRRALREAARVMRPDGRLVASLFAAPERSQGTVVHEAMSALMPPSSAGDHAPYALSAPDGLEAALREAGLVVTATGRGGLLVALRVDRARRSRGCCARPEGREPRRRRANRPCATCCSRRCVQFQDPRTGVVNMDNTFRWVLACR